MKLLAEVINILKGQKIEKLILIGLIGAIITVLAEMCQGAVPSADSGDRISRLFSSFENLPVWRIGIGSTVGAVGILMQFFGMYGIYLSFQNRETKAAKIYYWGMYIFSAVGAVVHILMSVMVYIYKIDIDLMIEFTLWFVLPILLIFFVGYISFGAAMAIQFYRKQTPFYRWLWVLNPLFGKVFFGAIAEILPSNALTNGIAYSNMGLSSAVLFGVILFGIRKEDLKF